MGRESGAYAAELVLDELLEPDEELDDDEPDDEELDELDELGDESEDDDVEEAVDGFDAGALLDDEPRLSLR